MPIQLLRRAVPAALMLPMLAAPPSAGQTLDTTESLKLTASDVVEAQQFGWSVAISDTTAIIGATGDNDNGSGSGSVYLFDTTTGLQIAKLTASDAAAGDNFGRSVAISGNTAIIGAPFDDDAGVSSGSAYLFDTTTGVEIAKLTASDAAAGDLFGFSVAISGTTAIVGAWGDGDAGFNTGSAYLFDTTTGVQIAKLTASDFAGFDSFGYSVAISGTTAVVGAFGNDDAGSNSGSAYLFDTTTGVQVAKLTASDAASGDNFGRSVAISGNTAIVGAPFDDDAGFSSGSAYLFDTTTGVEVAKLTASDATGGAEFGGSMAIAGTTAVVGAPRMSSGQSLNGAAYVYDTTNGEELVKLTASDAAANDFYGSTVAISGGTAIIGAYGDDFFACFNADSNPGSAYVFQASRKIVQQPLSDVVNFGATASFHVELADSGGATYQWRRNGVALADGGNISGSNTATLQIIAGDTDKAFYDCVISSQWGPPTTSQRAVLGVLPDPNACYPDANGDGVLDFFDISQFIIEFGRGCP